MEGNPEELREVMVGLIDNAVAAMPEGGDLHLSVEESAGNAYVYVQDSGTGIPEEIAGRVMDPFFTTKGNGGERPGPQSGLGGPEKASGGDLDIESKEGEGNHRQPFECPWAKRATAGERTRPGRRGVKNVRILVLEEEHMIRELFFQVLSGKGIQGAD